VQRQEKTSQGEIYNRDIGQFIYLQFSSIMSFAVDLSGPFVLEKAVVVFTCALPVFGML
jgi:hypothetical protein